MFIRRRLYEIVCVLFLLIGSLKVISQERDKLPFFRIGLTDLSYFDRAKLNKDKPVIFIYYLPDCDHCRNFIKVLLYNNKFFRNIQIVMITNSSLNQVRQFEKEFKLKAYANLISGTEGMTFAFQRQFKIEKFPFIVLYDNKGHLIKLFREDKDPNELIKKIRESYSLDN